MNAGRLTRRLERIVRALDDLPGQAQRFARWRARRDAGIARLSVENAAATGDDRVARDDGHRPARRFNASSRCGLAARRVAQQANHEVYQVLKELHGLALWARAGPAEA